MQEETYMISIYLQQENDLEFDHNCCEMMLVYFKFEMNDELLCLKNERMMYSAMLMDHVVKEITEEVHLFTFWVMHPYASLEEGKNQYFS